MVHPLQTPAWAAFRTSMGVDVTKFGTWYISFHPIPFTSFTIGYFPKGPMPTKKMLADLEGLGKQKNAIFIQLEPNVVGNFQLLKKSHHPLFTKYTFVMDLKKPEEELLRLMHPKTRYNIKVAQKHGVIVKEDNSNQALAAYLRLSKETTERQKFYAHSQTYTKNMWTILHKAGIARLWTATYKGQIIAAWIIFVHDSVMYYPYGASSRKFREVMAPYLLLWELVRWGKTNNLVSFDLWGALGPSPNPRDPWFGFHRFKAGFSPNLIEFIGSFDLVIRPTLYQLYCLADTIRWKVLKAVK